MTDDSISSRWLKGQRIQAGRLPRKIITFSVISGWLMILQYGLLAWIVNAVMIEGSVLNEQMPLIIALLPLFLIRAMINRHVERLSFQAGSEIRSKLRLELFDHLNQLGPMRLAKRNSAEISNALLEGVDALQDYYARYLPHMTIMTLIPLSILIVVLPLDWISALVFLVTAPLIPFFMILIGKGAESMNQKQWQKLARLGAYFLDILRGLPTLKILNLSRQEAQLVSQMSNDYRRSTLSVLKVAFLSSLVLEFLSTVSIAMVAVFIGFRLMWGEMNFLEGFFILLLAPEFYLPLRTMGTHYHARLQAVAAAGQLVELLSIKPPDLEQATEILPYSPQVTVEVEQVSYRYDEETLALQDINLRISPGEKIALVGPSGSGKTTLLHLLLGFDRPLSGDIFINQTNLATVDSENWLRQVAWVPQNPHLVHGTVMDNIVLGSDQVDNDRMHRAARLARADQFIERLNAGYNTLVGEGGQALSGGEVQRIALARAFYKDSPLVLLDEPTASLDAESEEAIRHAIDDLAKDRSLLIIAHRLQTVRDADRIYVMKQGKLVEEGTHKELQSQQGIYSGMLEGADYA